MKKLLYCLIFIVFLLSNHKSVAQKNISLKAIIEESLTFIKNPRVYSRWAEGILPHSIHFKLAMTSQTSRFDTTKITAANYFNKDSLRYSTGQYYYFFTSNLTKYMSSPSADARDVLSITTKDVMNANSLSKAIQITLYPWGKEANKIDIYLESVTITKIKSFTSGDGYVCNEYLIKGVDTSRKYNISILWEQFPPNP